MKLYALFNSKALGIYEHYKDKNIVFIKFCFEVDRDKWKSSIASKEKRRNVIKLYANGKTSNEYVRAYNVQGIPHYFIIDVEGKIQNHNAPRLSNLTRNLQGDELSKLLDQE